MRVVTFVKWSPALLIPWTSNHTNIENKNKKDAVSGTRGAIPVMSLVVPDGGGFGGRVFL